MTGAKAGRGFYQKRGDEILTLDPRDAGVPAAAAVRLPSLDAAQVDRDRRPSASATLFNGQDKVGAFLRVDAGARRSSTRRALRPRSRIRRDDVDRAMRWGFGWDVGPLTTLRR